MQDSPAVWTLPSCPSPTLVSLVPVPHPLPRWAVSSRPSPPALAWEEVLSGSIFLPERPASQKVPRSPSPAVLTPSCPFLSMAWGSGVPKAMETVDQFKAGSSGCVQWLPGLTCALFCERARCGWFCRDQISFQGSVVDFDRQPELHTPGKVLERIQKWGDFSGSCPTRSTVWGTQISDSNISGLGSSLSPY